MQSYTVSPLTQRHRKKAHFEFPRHISHTKSKEGLLRGKICPTDSSNTTPVTTNRYSKTSEYLFHTNVSSFKKLSSPTKSKVILPRDISHHPGGVESTAAHAHHPHPFTKTSLPLHDHSCNHSIDLPEIPSSQAVKRLHSFTWKSSILGYGSPRSETVSLCLSSCLQVYDINLILLSVMLQPKCRVCQGN